MKIEIVVANLPNNKNNLFQFVIEFQKQIHYRTIIKFYLSTQYSSLSLDLSLLKDITVSFCRIYPSRIKTVTKWPDTFRTHIKGL